MIIRTFLSVRRCLASRGARNYGSMYPFKKLRAYPFALPPEEAKLRMGIMAQRYCGEERFNGLFDHLKWAFLDIQPKLPVTFSAIYLPFWIIGARSYLRWTHMGGDEVPKGKVGAFNAFFPFFPVPGTHAPLFPTAHQFYHWDKLRREGFIPRPFTDLFLKEQEESVKAQITCLPYTTSPLALLKLVQSSPGRTLHIGGHHVQINQASIANFIAMPILLPMYVAKYRDKDGEDLIMFIDAIIMKSMPRADRRQLIHLSEKHGVALDTGLSRIMKDVDSWDFFGHYSRTEGGYIDSATHLTVGSRKPVDEFLDSMLGSAENLSQLASLGSLASDSDDRIVEMTESEIKTRWAQLIAHMHMSNRSKEKSTSTKKTGQEKDKVGIWSKYSSLPTPRRGPSSPNHPKPKGRT